MVIRSLWILLENSNIVVDLLLMMCHILKAAEVALHLSSVHRWCVTGTPIQKGLEGNVGWLLLSCIASVPIQAKSSSHDDHVKIVLRVQD